MRLRRILPIFLTLMIFIVSCATQSYTVLLNKDGSGKIIVKTKLSRMMYDDISMGGDGSDIYNKKEFKKESSQYGEKVSLIDFENISDVDNVGCIATYKFKDINKVTIDYTIGNADDQANPHYVTFNYNSSTGELKINIPESESKAESDSPDKHIEEDEYFESMMPLFENAKIDFSVSIDGEIDQTNASFVKDNVITIYDIEFNTIIEDENALATIASDTSISDPETISILNQLEGINIETQKEITAIIK